MNRASSQNKRRSGKASAVTGKNKLVGAWTKKKPAQLLALRTFLDFLGSLDGAEEGISDLRDHGYANLPILKEFQKTPFLNCHTTLTHFEAFVIRRDERVRVPSMDSNRDMKSIRCHTCRAPEQLKVQRQEAFKQPEKFMRLTRTLVGHNNIIY